MASVDFKEDFYCKLSSWCLMQTFTQDFKTNKISKELSQRSLLSGAPVSLT